MVRVLVAFSLWSIVHPIGRYNPPVLILALVVLLGACNRSSVEPEQSGSALRSEGLGAEAAGSGAAGAVDDSADNALVSPAPGVVENETVVAARPDGLLPLVPRGDAVMLLDLEALEAWAARGIRSSDSAERVAQLVSEVANARFAAVDPAAPTVVELAPGTKKVALAWGSGWARAVLDTPASGAAGAEHGLFVAEEGTPSTAALEIPSAMPLDALVTIGIRDAASLPEGLQTSLDFLDPFEVRTLWIGIRGDGSALVYLETDQPDAVVGALGRGQVWFSQMLGQLRSSVRPELQGWVTYLNRASQAVFGWVEVSTGEGHVLLQVPAPACGGPQRSLFALAFVTTVADFAAEDPSARSIPYVAMEGAIAPGCEAIEGPAASLPVSFAGLGARGSELAALGVLDLGALLREGLPTGFGLLPFALSGSTVDSVFGPRPMGMNGLDDGGAQIAWSGSVNPRSAHSRHGLMVPAGMHALAPEGLAIARLHPYQSAAALGWATHGFDLAADLAAEPAAVWSAGLEHAAEGALAALVVNAATLRAWSTKVPSTSSVERLLAEATGGVISLVPGGFSLALFGVEPEASPEVLRGEIAEAISLITRDVTNSSSANERLIASQEAMSQFEVRTDEDSLTLTLQGAGLPVIAAAIRVVLPMLTDPSRRGAILPPSNQPIHLPITVPSSMAPVARPRTP